MHSSVFRQASLNLYQVYSSILYRGTTVQAVYMASCVVLLLSCGGGTATLLCAPLRRLLFCVVEMWRREVAALLPHYCGQRPPHSCGMESCKEILTVYVCETPYSEVLSKMDKKITPPLKTPHMAASPSFARCEVVD